VHQSIVPDAVFTSTFRRMTRNNTHLVRNLDRNQSEFKMSEMVDAINIENGLTAAPIANFKTLAALENIKFEAPETLEKIDVWSVKSNLSENFVGNFVGFTGGLPSVTLWNANFNPTIFTGNLGGGVINNPGGGVIGNDPGGVINNPGGVINNPGGGVFNDPGGVINNPGGGVFNNPGGGVFNNPGGVIFNPGGGVFNNRCTGRHRQHWQREYRQTPRSNGICGLQRCLCRFKCPI
jgi:hypothetical protein